MRCHRKAPGHPGGGGGPPRPQNQVGPSTQCQKPRQAARVWCSHSPLISCFVSACLVVRTVGRGEHSKKKQNSQVQLHSAFKISSKRTWEVIFFLQGDWVISVCLGNSVPPTGVPENFPTWKLALRPSQGPGPPKFYSASSEAPPKSQPSLPTGHPTGVEAALLGAPSPVLAY